MWHLSAEKYGITRLEALRWRLSERNFWHRDQMPLLQVRRRLNGASDNVMQQLIENAGMPQPIHFNPEPVWDSKDFYCWRWAGKKRFWHLAKSNSEHCNRHPIGRQGYRDILTKQIHDEAHEHGCELSHTITISFKRENDAAWSARSVKAFNEAHRDHVERIGRSLGRACWRMWNRQCGIPDDLFLHFITPERLDRFGNEVPWHFHIDLFLRPAEARLLNMWWAQIEERIVKMVAKIPGQPVVQLQPVTMGFAGYSQKNIFDTVDMVSCNFLNVSDK